MTAFISSHHIAARAVRRIGDLGAFAWSAWTGVVALALIAAVWQWGHEVFGDFVLPSPTSVSRHVLALATDSSNLATIAATARRALAGLALSLFVGGVLGMLCGYSAAAMRVARPVLTVLLGVPPIAWIVLVMIWFGSSDTTIIATVVTAAAPLLFVGASEGVVGRDRGLDDMARLFGAGPVSRFAEIGLRQVLPALFPALRMATGTAFKVAVMAELLTNAGGIGGALADARATLDVGRALAWILIAVTVLMCVEYGLIHPVRSEFERWRKAAQPWGVKR